MRLFYAVDPSPPARALAVAAMQAPVPGLNVKWAGADGLHVTLVFLGEVAADRLPELEALTREVAMRHRPFRLSLASAGVFGAPPQVLWLGVAGELTALAALQADLQATLRVKDEHQRYHPHLTLARARSRHGDPALSAAAQALQSFGSEPFEVAAFTLYQSAGGGYRALAEHRLTGETA